MNSASDVIESAERAKVEVVDDDAPEFFAPVSSDGAYRPHDLHGFDISIAVTESLPDSGWVAHRLARTAYVLCAAPEYLDRRGRPRHPRELMVHDVMFDGGQSLRRGLTFRRGHHETFDASPRRGVLSSNHTDIQYAAALAGLAISALPSYIAEDALFEQALERVLPEWQVNDGRTIWACMLSQRHVASPVRATLDFLIEIFGGEDRDPWTGAPGMAVPGPP
jgi:DNA-binding transcriptional LysR family regulator